MRIFAALFLALAAVTHPAMADEVTLDGTGIALETVATGFDSPVYLTAPPGDPRLFVVEQTGRIRIIDGSSVLPAPFLDIADQISSGGERGLLGLAFHPDHAANGRFFVYVTAPNGDIRIAELRRQDASRADAASLRVLVTIPHRAAANHNGGWLAFGPDGLLYAGVGDGGGAGDRQGNAQNPASLLGKLLRLDVDAPGTPAPEIVAQGLRNPWRNDFDGDRLYIADVGQNEWEEINVIAPEPPGTNLGWNRMEGNACFRTTACNRTGLTLPVMTYDHDTGCSITGGFVYRGAALPALQGRYFFSDYCSGTLRSMRLGDEVAITTSSASLGNVTSFGEDAAGEIYILTQDGTVRRLIPAR